MANRAIAEIHQHGMSDRAAILLAVAGLIMLTLVYMQGTIYTRESQLTRERSDYTQQQIQELRSRVEMAEAKLTLAESRIQRMQK
jgi:hypothetical protein